MSVQNSKNNPFVTFSVDALEREASAQMDTTSISQDTDWKALVDPLIDGFAAASTATVAQKLMFKGLLKALAHSLYVNKKS